MSDRARLAMLMPLMLLLLHYQPLVAAVLYECVKLGGSNPTDTGHHKVVLVFVRHHAVPSMSMVA